MMHLSDENRGGVATAKKISGHATDSMFDRYNIQDERDLAEALKAGRPRERLPKEAAKARGTVISICSPEATRKSPGRGGAGK